MAYYNNYIPILSRLYPSLTWKKPGSEKTVYLTFDDGPMPGITNFVLQQLKEFNAQATFFCVGENIEKHPEQFAGILRQGHVVGNHTYNHLKGWNTDDPEYFANIKKCQSSIDKNSVATKDYAGKKKLFRPPYGRIRRSQIRQLQQEYDIIMWNVLTGDYDKGQSPEKCLDTAIHHSDEGAIVVFHDSYKAEKNLTYVLPRYLAHFYNLGYRFESL